MPTLKIKKLCYKHNVYYNDKCNLCSSEYNKEYNKNIRAKDRAKIYNSSKWKKIREIALLRDSFLCQECLRNGIETKATIVHHKIELKEDITLAFDLDNLESICDTCHNREHR